MAGTFRYYVAVVFWSFKWSWAWSWGYNVRWLRLNHVMCWEALQVAALEQEAGATSFSFQILVTLANDTLLQHRACAWRPVHRKNDTGHALGGLYIEKLVS